jgi:hypothetical protein
MEVQSAPLKRDPLLLFAGTHEEEITATGTKTIFISHDLHYPPLLIAYYHMPQHDTENTYAAFNDFVYRRNGGNVNTDFERYFATSARGLFVFNIQLGSGVSSLSFGTYKIKYFALRTAIGR